MGPHGKHDRFKVKFLGRPGSTDPTAVFATGIGGNLLLFTGWTLWVPSSNLTCEFLNIFLIQNLPPQGLPFPARLPEIGVGQTFFLGPLNSLRLGQNALSLVALPRATPLHDNGMNFRILRRTTGQGGITTEEKLQVIQVRARQTEGFPVLQRDQTPLPQLLLTLGAFRRSPYTKDDNFIFLF